MAEMIRVNTRVSPEMMSWIDKRSEETGIPKSTIVMLALENYKQQFEAMDMTSVLGELVKRLEGIEQGMHGGRDQ